MARAKLSDMPRLNPCAQCARPIPFPDWVESGEGRKSYLWRCRACGYKFEAIAFFEESETDQRPLAA